ncbi:hypothetical protein, partial [Salmonella enterica]|uniref:YhdP family protein n=1 Tax=Salmonella enterica TaxID=28901 RepID=UPI00398C66B4
VISNLPSPLSIPEGDAIRVNIQANGNLKSFALTATAGSKNHFNSRWLLNQKLTLYRAIWTTDSRTIPPLPAQQGGELNLPALDGAQWLALFQKSAPENVSSSAGFPQRVTLRTHALSLAGQTWNNC